MNTKHSIELQPDPGVADMNVIFAGLDAYNREHAELNQQYLVITVRDDDENVIGGLVGTTYLKWLYVQAVWIPEKLRGTGVGTSLLQMAEAEALRRGCRNVWLDTFSFQALPFYQKLGYKIFGELPDYPPGVTRYFLTRSLEQDPPSREHESPSGNHKS